MCDRCDSAPEEATICPDCGIDAWGFVEEDGLLVHEDFYVHNELWDATCPDDNVERWVQHGVEFGEGTFVICIGCFEKRLGRKLVPADFKAPPHDLFGTPPSRRFTDRWAS